MQTKFWVYLELLLPPTHEYSNLWLGISPSDQEWGYIWPLPEEQRREAQRRRLEWKRESKGKGKWG